MGFELVAKSYCEGEGLFPRGSIELGDLLRNTETGGVFMVESDAFVREFYKGSIWSDDLWRWEGWFPRVPDSSFTDDELAVFDGLDEL